MLFEYVNTKGADQLRYCAGIPGHIDSQIALVSYPKFPASSLIASVATQTGLCLTWSETLSFFFFATRLILVPDVGPSCRCEVKELFLIDLAVQLHD